MRTDSPPTILTHSLAAVLFLVSCDKTRPTEKSGRIRQAVDLRHRIVQPDVRRLTQDFPAISFQEYDEVSVRAGGCVNTPSDSSRRYVDPIGRRSAASGHGMISIPGATVGFENIGGVIARSPVHVPRMPAGAKEQLFLRLGYDAPDPGNDYQISAGELDQCAGLEPAWVEVDITHHFSPATLACPPRPLDLHWTAVDPNLLPLNPIWGEQCRLGHAVPTAAMSLCDNFTVNSAFSNPWAPACTSHLLTANYCHQPSWPLCSPDFPFPDGTLRGHANWGFATVTGKLRYLNHLGGLGGDDDFSFDLLSDQGLVTPRNHVYEGIRALIIEFDKGETVDRIRDFAGSFWARFGGLDEAGRGAMTFNLPAQAIGLIGIDAVHGFSELHPVIGLAIQYRQYGPDSVDSWAIFARRGGNEGGCSGAARSCGQAGALGGPANIDSGLEEIRFMLPRTYKEATYRVRGLSNAAVDTSFGSHTLVVVPLAPVGEIVGGEIEIRPSGITAISQRVTARP